MNGTLEPDQRKIIGYSIRAKAHRDEWIALVRGIAAMVENNGWQHGVVFHGTSEMRLPLMIHKGIDPTDVELATEGHPLGSFWGDVHTAAAYAEDTAKVRDQSRPVLLASLTSVLADASERLVPDLATLDFPMKGLTRLEDEGVVSRWVDGHGYRTRSWKEALDDLRAIVAVHETPLPSNIIVVVTGIDDVHSLMASSLPRP